VLYLITLTVAKIISFSYGTTAPSGSRSLIVEALRSHSDTPRSVGHLWTNDQPEKGPLPDKTQHSQQIYMPPTGLELTIERSQTHAFDVAATRNGAKLI